MLDDAPQTPQDTPAPHWVIAFTRGARGSHETIQVKVTARSPASARRAALAQAIKQGAPWAASAQAAIRKCDPRTKQDESK